MLLSGRIYFASGKRVYVIGELFHGSREKFVGASPEKKTTALVSIKSEEAVLGDSKKQLLLLAFSWIVFGAIAAILFNMAW